jgi:hypothetical protein
MATSLELATGGALAPREDDLSYVPLSPAALVKLEAAIERAKNGNFTVLPDYSQYLDDEVDT